MTGTLPRLFLSEGLFYIYSLSCTYVYVCMYVCMYVLRFLNIIVESNTSCDETCCGYTTEAKYDYKLAMQSIEIIRTCVWMEIVSLCMYVCMCVCMYVCTYVYKLCMLYTRMYILISSRENILFSG